MPTKRESIAATMIEVLVAEGVAVAETPDLQAFGFGVEGENGKWPCFVRVDEEARVLILYSLCPAAADAAHRAAALELLTRLNFSFLSVGSLEIDLDDGDIRVKTGLDLEDTPASAPLLRRLFYANVGTMDAVLPAIIDVLAGASVTDALKRLA